MRAAIALAASGMESSLKRLVRDALPHLVQRRQSNRDAYEQFLRDQLRSSGTSTPLERSLVAQDPTSSLLEFYVQARVTGSILSVNDLRGLVFGALCVSKRAIPDTRITELSPFLKARTHVVHDLDLLARDEEGTSLKRRGHQRATVVSHCNLAVQFTHDVILHTSYLLREKQ